MNQLVHGPVRTATLKPCPVSVSNHSVDIQKSLREADLESASAVLPIHVARIGTGYTYVVDGQMRVDEMNRRKIKTVEAYVHEVKDEASAVVLHVRLHQSSPANPLGLIDAYNYLKKSGLESEGIMRMLWLDPMQKYVATHEIDPKARQLLEKYLQKMTEKFSRVSYPMYMIAMICKLDPSTQKRAVENVIRHMNLDCTRARFSFPSAGQLDALISEAKSQDVPEPVMFALNDDEYDDLNESGNKARPTLKTKTHGLDRDLYSHLKNSRDDAVLSCKCGIIYKVNIKTRSMSEIKIKNDVISIESGSQSPIAAIPPTIIDKLGAEVGEDVFFKVSTAKSLSKLLAKKSPQDKFLVCSKKRL